MDILVIYNQQAGSGSNLAALRQLFASSSKRVVFQALAASLKQQIGRAVAGGCTLVVAAGGDGTVNAVMNAAIKQPVAIGVLPVGTLNHFAKDLGMPNDTAKAVAVILQGHTMQIDIAEGGGRYFINNASFGLYPKLVWVRESRERFIGKWPALLWAFLKILPRLRRYHVELTCDGKRQMYRTPFVLVSNNCYGKADLATRPSLTTGKLGVYILQTTRFSHLLRLCWRALNGKLASEKVFTKLTAKTVRLKRQNGASLLLAYDGEVVSLPQKSVTFRVMPHALRVIVPLTS